MTENEAIERIKTGICCEKGTTRYCTDACMYGKEKCAYSVAIKALKEIQQYRTIGTVEECWAAVEKQKEMIAYCNENDCSDCYCNNGNWKETNRCMNDFIAEEIGQVAEIKWGDEE